MKTITIDIINEKVLKLLHELELLQLIRVRKKESQPYAEINWNTKYKGAMTQQSLNEIDAQLNSLRNEWE